MLDPTMALLENVLSFKIAWGFILGELPSESYILALQKGLIH